MVKGRIESHAPVSLPLQIVLLLSAGSLWRIASMDASDSSTLYLLISAFPNAMIAV
jgi:hypothetical protein